VYKVFRKLEDGKFLLVASRDNREEALQLVTALNTHWPGDYIVRDSEGRNIRLTK